MAYQSIVCSQMSLQQRVFWCQHLNFDINCLKSRYYQEFFLKHTAGQLLMLIYQHTSISQ